MNFRPLFTSLCVVISASFAGSDARAQTTLSFGYGLPETSTFAAQGVIPWLDRVQELTDGEITTELFAGGSVVQFPTSLQALRDGLLDGALVSTVYYRSELPVNTLVNDLGYAFDNQAAALVAMTQMMTTECPECLAELAEQNITPLGFYSGPAYDLMCREAVSSLDDLAGMRVKAAGLLLITTEELGAVPVNISVTELYESLQRGVVDCAFADTSWLERFSLNEVVEQVVVMGAGVGLSGSFISIRRDFYNELTDEQKTAMARASADAMANLYMAESTLIGGSETSNPDIDFVTDADWVSSVKEAASARVLTETVSLAEDAGVENAQEIADRFVAIYEAVLPEFEEEPQSQQAFADLLWDRYYSGFASE